MIKHEFPKLINFSREAELLRRARFQIKYFLRSVKPVLIRFQLFDDEHIKRYIASDSMEIIYRDIVEKRGDFLRWLESEAAYRGEDVWQAFRSADCEKTLNPKHPDFKFAKLPNYFGNEDCKTLILQALNISNGQITINADVITSASIVRPTPEQKELYSLCAEFCEKLQEMNVRKTAQQLFKYEGFLTPNPTGVLGFQF